MGLNDADDSIKLFYDSVLWFCDWMWGVCKAEDFLKSLAQIVPLLSVFCVVLLGITMLLSPGSRSIPAAKRQWGLFIYFFIYLYWQYSIVNGSPVGRDRTDAAWVPSWKEKTTSTPLRVLPPLSQIHSTTQLYRVFEHVNLPRCFFPDAGINPDHQCKATHGTLTDEKTVRVSVFIVHTSLPWCCFVLLSFNKRNKKAS